jgi:hypothetical protein
VNIDPSILAQMTEQELRELDQLLLSDRDPWFPIQGPQLLAYESEADIVGYGGAAGGGKTDLICGESITKHKRVLIVRNEKAQTSGIVQRLTEILGNRDGYNGQQSTWQVSVGSAPLIEFGGLDNPGDESRWQGRAHDLKCFDEVTEMREAQVRFVMGWMRTNDPRFKPKVLMTFNPPMGAEGQWVIKFFAPWLDDMHPNPAKPGELRWFTTIAEVDEEVEGPDEFVLGARGERIYDFNPKDYTPEQIIKPKSRTFIPARVVDNPYYMATGYMSTLQSMPEPMRSRMLFGDFKAGIEPDTFQVIPTAWIDAAMKRWKPRDIITPMESLGADIAQGGRDNTLLIARHAEWFAMPIKHPGVTCIDGPTNAGFIVSALRDNAVIHLDLFGVGARPYGHLMAMGLQVVGVNFGEPAGGRDATGRFLFRNIRSEWWWRLREMLDPSSNYGIAIPPSRELRADLAAPRFRIAGPAIEVESREDIIKRLGRSPDYGTACILAAMNTRKLTPRERHTGRDTPKDYNPLDSF